MEAIVNDYIRREIVQDPSLLPLGNETSLLETGILDSLSLLRLVVFIQERFGVVVEDLDLVPEHFDQRGHYLRISPLSGRGGSRPGRWPWMKRPRRLVPLRSLALAFAHAGSMNSSVYEVRDRQYDESRYVVAP